MKQKLLGWEVISSILRSATEGATKRSLMYSAKISRRENGARFTIPRRKSFANKGKGNPVAPLNFLNAASASLKIKVFQYE